MKREEMPPTKRPDHITFELSDYYWQPGTVQLCYVCVHQTTANNCLRVSQVKGGLAKEALDSDITTAMGHYMFWREGLVLPCLPTFIADIALLFGPYVQYTDEMGVPIGMVAVTQKNGTALCATCLGWQSD